MVRASRFPQQLMTHGRCDVRRAEDSAKHWLHMYEDGLRGTMLRSVLYAPSR